MASKAQMTIFIDSIGPIVRYEAEKRGYGDAQIVTCIAQACLESGYGTSKLMIKGNALFGIKATKNWIQKATYGGMVYDASTRECFDGRTMTKTTSTFRAYPSLFACVADYFDLMETSRYKKSLTCRTTEECIATIKKSGYATDPDYVSKVLTCFHNNKEEMEKYIKAGTQKQKNNRDIALEVIQGRWGNGPDRVKNLTAAGYNYRQIQDIVNAILAE